MPTPTKPLRKPIKLGGKHQMKAQKGNGRPTWGNFVETWHGPFLFFLSPPTFFSFFSTNKSHHHWDRGLLFIQTPIDWNQGLSTLEIIVLWHVAHSHLDLAMPSQNPNYLITFSSLVSHKSFKAHGYWATWYNLVGHRWSCESLRTWYGFLDVVLMILPNHLHTTPKVIG